MPTSLQLEKLQSPPAWPAAICSFTRRSAATAAISRCCLLLAILALAQSLPSAPPAATNAPLAEPPIPKSEFDDKMPQGRDPFFPRSTRRIAVVPTAAPVKPAIDSANFLLKGIAGSADHRLAIINDRTFAAGEDGEVSTTSGKIRIRVIEIADKSVVIEFGDPPQQGELRLPRGF